MVSSRFSSNQVIAPGIAPLYTSSHEHRNRTESLAPMTVAKTSNTVAQSKKPLFIGIDVGGTNIKFGLVDDAGQTLAHHSIPTEHDKGPEDAGGRMAQAVEHL